MARSDESTAAEGAPDREAAQAAYDEAQQKLQAAAEAAAEAGQGLAAAVMQNIPDMEVEVNPGQLVSHQDKAYYGEGYTFAPDDHKGNDRLTLEGPTALALLQQGAVRIVGEASK